MTLTIIPVVTINNASKSPTINDHHRRARQRLPMAAGVSHIATCTFTVGGRFAHEYENTPKDTFGDTSSTGPRCFSPAEVGTVTGSAEEPNRKVASQPGSTSSDGARAPSFADSPGKRRATGCHDRFPKELKSPHMASKNRASKNRASKTSARKLKANRCSTSKDQRLEQTAVSNKTNSVSYNRAAERQHEPGPSLDDHEQKSSGPNSSCAKC